MNKVVIPQFIANWIEESIMLSYSLKHALNGYNAKEDVKDWLSNEYNEGIFARAWLDGYEIEKEPLYIVVLTDKTRGSIIQLFKNIEGALCFNIEPYIKFGIGYEMTEQEIKNEDERLWYFAIPARSSEVEYELY